MTRKPEDIRTALDATLSGASHDPTLYNRVVNATKGDSPPMKRKLTLSMAFVLILVLMTGTVAVAAGLNITTIQDFLSQLSQPIPVDEAFIESPLRQRHTSELMDITVEQLYLTDEQLYFTLHFTPRDDQTLLFPCGSNSIMLDGKEVRYWELWDTDYTLLQLGPMELDDLYTRNPIVPLGMPQYHQEEDGSYTLLCLTADDEIVKQFRTIGGGQLMLRFYIDDCRDRDREWNVILLDHPHLDKAPSETP